MPSPINHLISRGEFFTAYTPYQPEASQGTLRTIYEYQTMIAELTGMDVANASLYDGGSSLAEGALMAHSVTGRDGIVLSRGVNPLYRQVVETYCEGIELRITSAALADGATDLDALAKARVGDDGRGGDPVPELLRLPRGRAGRGRDRARGGRAPDRRRGSREPRRARRRRARSAPTSWSARGRGSACR